VTPARPAKEKTMREGTFHEEHNVELTGLERDLFGRLASRHVLDLEKHQATMKETKKKLAEREKELEKQILDESRAAETGTVKRQVECRERLAGVMVVTERLDTGETVSARDATKQELAGEERSKNNRAKEEEPETLGARILREVLKICAKPRAEALLLKALEKGLPNTTPLERKAAVNAALEAGRILEVDGKLVVPEAPPSDDGGIVDDSYAPAH
jgi:hypothetical protein